MNDMHIRKRSLSILSVFLLPLLVAAYSYSVPPAGDGSWVEPLTGRIEAIDRESPGNLGVYIKHLGDGQSLSWNAERNWYMASVVKIPVAIALLNMVEEGVHSLSDTLTLSESDFVDGAGDLLWTDPGTRFTVENLMERMVVQSDNTAADMLIRLVGEEELNRRIRNDMVEEGIEPITTLLQVRHDAYSEIHPAARDLSNMDFIEIHAERRRPLRYDALLERIGVASSEAKAARIEEAFDRYYSRRLNSGTLEAYGRMLERLVKGQLLSDRHTQLLLDFMEKIDTGDRRIKGGLPQGYAFSHKTGTQVERACNIGILRPHDENAIIIAACIENFGALENAESALMQLGRALAETQLAIGGE